LSRQALSAETSAGNKFAFPRPDSAGEPDKPRLVQLSYLSREADFKPALRGRPMVMALGPSSPTTTWAAPWGGPVSGRSPSGKGKGQARGPAPTRAAGTFSESMRQGPSFVGGDACVAPTDAAGGKGEHTGSALRLVGLGGWGANSPKSRPGLERGV